jgi:hypothetical protein
LEKTLISHQKDLKEAKEAVTVEETEVEIAEDAQVEDFVEVPQEVVEDLEAQEEDQVDHDVTLARAVEAQEEDTVPQEVVEAVADLLEEEVLEQDVQVA